MAEHTLDEYRREAGLSMSDLWLRYFALGGMSTPVELEAYVLGALQPTRHEHNLVAHAINERCLERGDDHPVPYADDAE
ncbi:MAG: hypothetical protein JOZ99_07820 [Actinobacteria bacterium]|nr:hypothetical protein [Actinomycetota bacterium]